jgi:multidrug efflux pump subunit AcrB
MWITRVAIRNPVFATMMMVALMVLGLFSYARLGVEQLPSVAPPSVFMYLLYPGASPQAVEAEVTKPLEISLNSVAGVRMIRSNSWEGRSEVFLEFSLDADMNRAMEEVRNRVGQVQVAFPRTVSQPWVARFDPENDQPTVLYSLSAPGRSARELALLAEQQVQRRLQRVEGVARIDVGGMASREVRIDLDAARLRAAGQCRPGACEWRSAGRAAQQCPGGHGGAHRRPCARPAGLW